MSSVVYSFHIICHKVIHFPKACAHIQTGLLVTKLGFGGVTAFGDKSAPKRWVSLISSMTMNMYPTP